MMENNFDNTKKEFVNTLIKFLNEEVCRQMKHNTKIDELLDICYLTSVVEQQIDKCSAFIKDIDKHRYMIDEYFPDVTNGYTHGKIKISIEKPDNEKESNLLVDAYYNYYYYIEFEYSTHYRYDGWDAPAITITKLEDINTLEWDGYEEDYNIYKKEFHKREINKLIEIEEYKKQQAIKEKNEQIKILQNEIEELKSNNYQIKL